MLRACSRTKYDPFGKIFSEEERDGNAYSRAIRLFSPRRSSVHDDQHGGARNDPVRCSHRRCSRQREQPARQQDAAAEPEAADTGADGEYADADADVYLPAPDTDADTDADVHVPDAHADAVDPAGFTA